MEEKMMKSLEFVQNEFAKIRTGKASVSLVENIQVEAYGTHMRLRELAGIATPEPRLIVIQPWDASVVQNVTHAIQKSELGINPVVDGKLIRVPLPEMSRERRQEFVKTAHKLAEEGRVHVRNVRHGALDAMLDPFVIASVVRDAAGRIDDLRGRLLGVPVHRAPEGTPVEAIARGGLEAAKRAGRDVVILDTAGRLTVDTELMGELAAVVAAVKPVETLLVVDAMTGQEAVAVAEAFHAAVPLTGLVLTKIDGDARGGAALSVATVTGRPVMFASTGEKLADFELFHPDRMASRILCSYSHVPAWAGGPGRN